MPSYISIISFVGRVTCQYIYFADHMMGENTACQYIKCAWGKITLVNTNNTCQYIYFADHVHEKARIWSRQNTSDTILFWLNVNTFISQITCKNSQNLVQTQYVWHHSVLIVSPSDCNFCNGVAEIGGQILPRLHFFFQYFSFLWPIISFCTSSFHYSITEISLC